MDNSLLEQTETFRLDLYDRSVTRLHEVSPERPEMARLLETYLNEVDVALELLDPIVRSRGSLRILEVGSGIGAVAVCLRSIGHSVVALEPRGPGFETAGLSDFRGEDDIRFLQDLIAASASEGGVPSEVVDTLSIGVEDLDAEVHGRFDIVFSVNVLEHVPDPAIALKLMQSVLLPNGMQRHLCPNYAFPYEPHFSRPLVPFFPNISKSVLPREVTRTKLWNSINFVTARQIRRSAQVIGVSVQFDSQVLAEAVKRFAHDPVFAKRHSGLGMIVRVMGGPIGMRFLDALPAAWVSPMRFTFGPHESRW